MFGIFIIGITEVFKQLGVPAKYMPLICILISTGMWLALIGTYDVVVAIEGALIGMSVTGLVNLGKGGLENLKK